MNHWCKWQIYDKLLSRCKSRLWEVYSFFRGWSSAWIIIGVKSLCQDQSGSSSNPTFKVSRKQYPNHAKMLESAQNEGHSLTNLTRGSSTRAAQKIDMNQKRL